MKAIVLVRALTPEGVLPERLPMCLLPLADRPFLQHVVEALTELGVTEIIVRARAGLGRLRAVLGDGTRWGCAIRVDPRLVLDLPTDPDENVWIVEAETLLPELGRPDTPLVTTFANGAWAGWALVPSGSLPVDEIEPDRVGGLLTALGLPTASAARLACFTPEGLLGAQREYLQRLSPDKAPVHVARSARIHRTAVLTGPVWVGPNCRVGAGVRLGPNVCLSQGVIVERDTNIQNALLAEGTFVGAGMELNTVLADRGYLAHLRLQTGLRLPEAFLGGALRPPRRALSRQI